MDSHAEALVQQVPNISTAESHREDDYIYVYHGRLADGDESVRVVTVAPDVTDEDVRSAFSRRAAEWQNTSSDPNIVTVSDRGDSPFPWLATEWITGHTLDTVQPNLTPSNAAAVVTDAAEAVRNAALYNTAHGALSPQSILVVPGDDGVSALIDEWGVQQTVEIAADAFVPTRFTAPELLGDPEAATDRTDVYGLGAIAYYTLTGAPPVTGTDLPAAIRSGEIAPPSHHDDELPEAVDEVLLQSLATDPDERYESAYTFKRAFRQAYQPMFESSETTAVAADAPDDGNQQADDSDADDAKDGMDDDADDTLVTTRRTAVGLLGVGVGGLGGGLLAARMGDDDATVTPATTDEAGAAAETATPAGTAPDGETAPTTETATETEPPGGSETPTGWTVEGFEDSTLADWNNVESAEITDSRAYSGDRSLVITDQHQGEKIGNSITLPIERSAPSRVQATLLTDGGAWNTVTYKLRDDSNAVHDIRLHHADGSTDTSLYYGNREVTLRDRISPYEWYHTELFGIQWDANTIDEIRVDGAVVARDVPFLNDATGVTEIQLVVHDGGVGSTGYFDDISLGTPR